MAKQLSKQQQLGLHVYNHRSNKNLKRFLTLKCSVNPSLNAIIKDADLYLICVSDAAIPEVVNQLVKVAGSNLVLHTSGSTDLNVFQKLKINGGVLYPLQTFSMDAEVNWDTTPVLIEAVRPAMRNQLKKWAMLFSVTIQYCNSKKRLAYHLNAVFVNNFVNALYSLSETYCKKNKLNFKLLNPIIQSTVAKVIKTSPLKSQTGPAMRGDEVTVNKHLQLLKLQPIEKQIYLQLSELIKKQHGKL